MIFRYQISQLLNINLYLHNLFKFILSSKFPHKTILIFILWISAFDAIATPNSNQPLTLNEAESLALWDKFKLQPTKIALSSGDIQTKVDQPSSDTYLVFDTVNFSPNPLLPQQDDKTVVNVGLHKAFSNNETQEIQSQQALVTVKQKNNQLKKRQLLRDVRHDWLELYYGYQAAKIIENNSDTITQLADKILSEANSHHSAQDALQAKLALIRMNNQKNTIQKKITTAKTQLARWIGKPNSNRPLPDNLPPWPDPPALPTLQSQLINHPQLQADTAQIKAIEAESAWSKQLNKPTLEVGASYGMRQQDAINADPKLDMISGQLSLNLPSHSGTTQMQDTLAISNRLNAARQQQQINSRNLLKNLIKQYLTWQNLDHQLSKMNNAASDNSTIQNPTHLSTTLSALQTQLQTLDTQLNQLRTAVDLAQARAALRYFEKD
ncbi:MAG TPA: TolC family protein [Gammaproteobacteria bacterium]|nr:TolC family protein [Gammaproteobacteria bacterium]